MKTAIAKVTGAVANKHINATFTHYLMKDKRVYASDGRVTASAPIPQDLECAISAADLDAALARMEDPTFVLDGGTLIVKEGRKRASIKTLAIDAFTHVVPDQAETNPVPESFFTTLKKVRPFISDNASRPWALCAYVHEDHIYATNNVVLVRAPIEGHLEGLLPSWAIDFVIERDERPTSVFGNDNYIAFFWADGSWLRAQLVNDQFPGAAIEMLATADMPRGEQLSEEWKEAVRYVAGLSESEIRIGPEQMKGAKNVLDAIVDIETPVREETSWHPQFLLPVLDVATHWDLDTWPRPSPWFGPGIEGIIVGRT